MHRIPSSLCSLVEQACGEHSTHVALLASRLALLLGEDVELACMSGYLHDLGKVLVPREILDKPGPLTPEEWAIMRRHPQDGYHLLLHYWPSAPESVAQAVLGHHERLDGSGYPSASQVMSRLTSIVAAADVYDALTANRSYRNFGMSSAMLRSLLMGQALPHDVLSAVSRLLEMDLSVVTTASPEVMAR